MIAWLSREGWDTLRRNAHVFVRITASSFRADLSTPAASTLDYPKLCFVAKPATTARPCIVFTVGEIVIIRRVSYAGPLIGWKRNSRIHCKG